MKAMGKSILAVFVGLVTTYAVFVFTFWVLSQWVPDDSVYFQSVTPLPALIMREARCLCVGALGGWVTAIIAGRRQVRHGTALGVVIVASGVIGALLVPEERLWAIFTFFVAVAIGAVLGGISVSASQPLVPRPRWLRGVLIASGIAVLYVALCILPLQQYKQSSLDVHVRDAVESARWSAAWANRDYHRTIQDSRFAQELARNSLSYERNGSTYVGQVAGENGQEYPNGLGVITETDRTTYSGQFKDGAAKGHGVLTVPSSTGERRWTGLMDAGHPSEAGILLTADGSTFSGLTSKASGVIDFGSSGLKYEGQTLDGVPQGYGVMWDSFGLISEQGVWGQGKLITALGAAHE
jgi:hypothetical protein